SRGRLLRRRTTGLVAEVWFRLAAGATLRTTRQSHALRRRAQHVALKSGIYRRRARFHEYRNDWPRQTATDSARDRRTWARWFLHDSCRGSTSENRALCRDGSVAPPTRSVCSAIQRTGLFGLS